MIIKDLLKNGIEILNEKKHENPTNVARIILAFTLDKNKEFLIVNDILDVEEEKQKEYFKYINLVANGYPLQYITKNVEFMKLNFYVDENVLIPRQDTEILVEEVLSLKGKKVLDMCTGSGCIAISVAKYLQNSEVDAIDIKESALDIARKNAINNNVDVNFFYSNMFENISEKYDIIVSNPPYIETKIIESLDENVKHEPYIALDGGYDGTAFYKILAENAYKFLSDDGYLCLEIGYNQKNIVIDILKNTNKYDNIYSKKDLSGNDRIIVASKLSENYYKHKLTK